MNFTDAFIAPLATYCSSEPMSVAWQYYSMILCITFRAVEWVSMCCVCAFHWSYGNGNLINSRLRVQINTCASKRSKLHKTFALYPTKRREAIKTNFNLLCCDRKSYSTQRFHLKVEAHEWSIERKKCSWENIIRLMGHMHTVGCKTFKHDWYRVPQKM